jgi:stage II sporulation protein P
VDRYQRSLRIGVAAILCALCLRMYTAGTVQRVLTLLSHPNIAPFLIYLETGRNVRFSASTPVPEAHERESPPPQIPWVPEETQPQALPSYCDTALTQLHNASARQPDLVALLEKPLQWQLCGSEPTVLILHTHATESYTKSGESYRETASWRTLDENYNMLSVGSWVAQILEENGICVLHDRTLHDYPSYNGSYTAARETMNRYLEEYPSIRLVLDLHRDASGTGSNQLRTRATVQGQNCAQLMLVMGTNYEAWEENLSLALKLQAQLETQAPGITRPTQLRTARFNQDLCPGALLIEVGAAGNTHPEAMLAAEQLAGAVVALARGTE